MKPHPHPCLPAGRLTLPLKGREMVMLFPLQRGGGVKKSHNLRQSRRLDKTVNRSKRLKTMSHLCGNYSNIFS
jgi:hypothetical protein